MLGCFKLRVCFIESLEIPHAQQDLEIRYQYRKDEKMENHK